MRSKVNNNSTTTNSSGAIVSAGDGSCSVTAVGILSFEIAGAMSRAAHLHRSLSDSSISRLRSRTLSSPSLLALVSPNPSFLLSLAAADFLHDLNRIASLAARLGRRCSTTPQLLAFDHIYSDLLSSRLNPSQLPQLLLLSPKQSNLFFKKLDRLVSTTAALYSELEKVDDLELSRQKLPADEDARKNFDRRIESHRNNVRRLREQSLWGQTYEKTALVLSRAVCSIFARLRNVFGDAILFPEAENQFPVSGRVSGPFSIPLRRHSGPVSGQIQMSYSERKTWQQKECITNGERLKFHCGTSPGRFLFECLSLSSSDSVVKDVEDQFEDESYVSAVTGSIVPFSGLPLSGAVFCAEQSQCGIRLGNSGSLWFGPKSRLASLAPPSTVGGSALALHYANIIIIIEKLLKYPHLVGEEARDDLYSMLPSSLRAGLRKSLKTYVKNLAIYDAPLAHDWKEALDKILSWLAPMAHNMIRWQTERNFEQQQIVLNGNVLLLETLYFADRGKTEAAICELLVGLNYICRYEQQQNALLDCTSSLDFDDCIDWQGKY